MARPISIAQTHAPPERSVDYPFARMLQISGISLLTMAFLNILLARHISVWVDMLFVLTGAFLLWVSYSLWQRRRHVQRKRTQALRAAMSPQAMQVIDEA